MNGTTEDVKTEASQGTKEKSKSGIKKKGSKKQSKKKEIVGEDKKPPENDSSNQGPDESKKGNITKGSSFEGDFFKDFYYAQGDYKAEEAEEVEELKHAIDVENEEPK